MQGLAMGGVTPEMFQNIASRQLSALGKSQPGSFGMPAFEGQGAIAGLMGGGGEDRGPFGGPYGGAAFAQPSDMELVTNGPRPQTAGFELPGGGMGDMRQLQALIGHFNNSTQR